MNLSIYVGPYLALPNGFDWYEWDHIVTDGRMEAREDGEDLILIPNVKLPGIDRMLTFDKYDSTPVVAIHTGHVVDEINALSNLADSFLRLCRTSGIPVCIRWGIVPCWS